MFKKKEVMRCLSDLPNDVQMNAMVEFLVHGLEIKVMEDLNTGHPYVTDCDWAKEG